MSIDVPRVVVTGILTADDALLAMKALGKWRPFRYALMFAVTSLVVAAMATANQPDIRWPIFAMVGALALFAIFGIPSGMRSNFMKSWNANPQFQQPIVRSTRYQVLRPTHHSPTNDK